MSIIKFKGVTKRFSDGTVAFSNLSFEVDEGETILFTGPSGSGKTTVMRLLIGEYIPSQGEILFEEGPLNQIKHNRLHLHRRKIGVVFQDYKLIEELNVWENVALPLFIRGESQAVIEERVTDLLKLVELTDKALMFPRQLSGGESQRISIARALANSPKVIFADEPTGNLDQETGERIIHLLTKINELGTTLLLATHDPLIIKEVGAKKIDLSEFTQEKKEGSKPKKISIEDLVSEKSKNNQKEEKSNQEEEEEKREEGDKKEETKKDEPTEKEKDKESSKSEADSPSEKIIIKQADQQPKNNEKTSKIGSFFSKLLSKKPKKKEKPSKNPYKNNKQPSIEDLLPKDE